MRRRRLPAWVASAIGHALALLLLLLAPRPTTPRPEVPLTVELAEPPPRPPRETHAEEQLDRTAEEPAPSRPDVLRSRRSRPAAPLGGGVPAGPTGDIGAALGDSGLAAPGSPAPLGHLTPPRPLEDYGRRHINYAEDAIRAGARGEIWIRLEVDAAGRVRAARLLRGVGYGLDEMAEDMARDFRFAPARDPYGNAVPAVTAWRFVVGAAVRRPGSGSGSGASEAPVPPLPPREPAPRPAVVVQARRAPVVALGRSGLPLQAPIEQLTPKQREHLCTWRVAVQGGEGASHSCALPEDEDVNGVDRRSLGDPATVEEMAARQYGRFRPPERVDFVVSQARCVKDAVEIGTCSVTVAQYERCMLALSVDPCRGWHAPACAPVAQCTGRTLQRAMPVGDLHDQAIRP